MFDTAQIAAVVFDLFHTLVSLEVPRAPGRATARILGVDEDEWREAWTSDPGDYAVGREDVDGPLRRLARRLNPGVSEAQIAEALATRHKRFGWALENVEDETLAGLRELRGRGYALGLVSNCGRDEVAHWAESPLAALLDCAVFSCEVGLRKPDERIFRLASARLGVRPEECLFVGNGGSDELAGAAAVGMQPVLIRAPHDVSSDWHRVDPEAWTGARVDAVSGVLALLETDEE